MSLNLEFKNSKDIDMAGYGHTLGLSEIDQHRHQIQQVIGRLELQKVKILPNHYRELMNHLQYSLTILDNMITFKNIEENSPYNPQRIGKNGYTLAQPSQVIYNQDGTTRIVHPDQKNASSEHREEWETQFDTNIMNPPCYIQPPGNVWNIDQIQKMHLPRNI